MQSPDCFDKILYRNLIHIFCTLLQKANIKNKNLKGDDTYLLFNTETKFLVFFVTGNYSNNKHVGTENI
jgi:hypothetical protein